MWKLRRSIDVSRFGRLSILTLAVFALALSQTAFAKNGKTKESSEHYVFKVAVEKHLEEKLNKVLTEIAGEGNTIVIVSADVETDEKKWRSQAGKKSKALVLPGVPVKQDLGQSEEIIPTMVRRLEVTILLDIMLPETMTETVHDMAIAVIGYNPDRGDRLIIKTVNFRRKEFQWESMLFPPHLYYAIATVLAAIFLLSAALFLINPMKKLALKVTEEDIGGEGLPGGMKPEDITPLDVPEKTSREQADRDSPLPFDFVTERHIPDLAYLLKGRPEDIAVVANYLEPELSTMLIELYPPEVRAEVALHLSRTEDAGKEKVREVEESIRSRLDYVVGGVAKLTSVLNLTDKETQESVLSALEDKNPKVAARLRKRLKSFQDILRTLRPATLLAIIQQVDFTTFARVLKAEPEDLQQKIVGSLTEGASERLREELEYSRPFGTTRLKREKLNMLRILRRMAEAGLIEEEEL
jgi:hypothetical protein